MKKNQLINALMVTFVSTVMVAGPVFADESVIDKAKNAGDKIGNKISDSVNEAATSVKATVKEVTTSTKATVEEVTITAKVKSALLANKDTKDCDISVETEKGVVTLSGSVYQKDFAKQAVEIAKKIDGIKSVNNKLSVSDKQPQSITAYVNDSAITAEISAKLLADKMVDSGNIDVKTTNGIVSLSGSVKSAEQSTQAARIASTIKGVENVVNKLSIKP